MSTSIRSDKLCHTRSHCGQMDGNQEGETELWRSHQVVRKVRQPPPRRNCFHQQEACQHLVATETNQWTPALRQQELQVQKLSVMVAYVPIDNAKKEEKDHFKGSGPEWYISSMLYSWDIPFWSGTLEILHSTLQADLDDIPSHSMFLLKGDFKARVSCSNENNERVLGWQRRGDLTDNDKKKLIALCKQNDFLCTQDNSQTDLDISRGKMSKPDRLHHHQQQVKAFPTRCASDVTRICWKWQQPAGGEANPKTEVSEDWKYYLDIHKLKIQASKKEFCTAQRNWFNMLQDEGELTTDHLNNLRQKYLLKQFIHTVNGSGGCEGACLPAGRCQ